MSKFLSVFSSLTNQWIGDFNYLTCAFKNSEGSSLTKDDQKAYWGTITGKRVAIPKVNGTDAGSTDYIYKKIEIDGAVMVGWGLEQCSMNRFKMMEIEEEIAD